MRRKKTSQLFQGVYFWVFFKIHQKENKFFIYFVYRYRIINLIIKRSRISKKERTSFLNFKKWVINQSGVPDHSDRINQKQTNNRRRKTRVAIVLHKNIQAKEILITISKQKSRKKTFQNLKRCDWLPIKIQWKIISWKQLANLINPIQTPLMR